MIKSFPAKHIIKHKTQSKVNNVTAYFLSFMLLALSGNPLFIRNRFFIIGFGLFLIFRYIILASHLFSSDIVAKLGRYLGYFVLIFFLQYITLQFVSVEGAVFFCFKIIIGLIIVYLLGYSFREKYLAIMYLLALISIPLFFINFIGVVFPGIETGRIISVGVYGYISNTVGFSMRYSGMFWEPGAYAGYILMIPLFYINSLSELWNQHRKKCIVLIVALLTTMSTAGYIILFFILLYYLYVKSKRKILFYVFSPVIFAGAFWGY